MPVRLFIGNLDYAVTEQALRDLFMQVGPVTSVRIPIDRDSGRPRGFAFVDFAEREHAEQAIQRFHETSFEGRRLAVNEAVERSDASRPRPSFGGGGGHGGGGGYGGGTGGGPGPTTRRFGPDAAPASKRKNVGAQAAKGPRGPIKERRGGGSTAGDDDSSPDEVPFWAVGDSKDDDE